jgi:hypothetical protein
MLNVKSGATIAHEDAAKLKSTLYYRMDPDRLGLLVLKPCTRQLQLPLRSSFRQARSYSKPPVVLAVYLRRFPRGTPDLL